MMWTGADALERSTLSLVNRVALTAQSREHLRLAQRVAELDVSPFDVRILLGLHGARSSVSDVAAGLGVDVAQVSRRATVLEHRGLLLRLKDDADRRRTLLALAPATEEGLDRWVQTWMAGYVAPVAGWDRRDCERLARWFRYVHDRLAMAVPRVPVVPAGPGGQGAPQEQLLDAALRLFRWVERSRGFNELLRQVGDHMSQHAYFALRVVLDRGPLSVGDVATALGIEHSQASKRLSHLAERGFVERTTSAADRRASLLTASAEARALVSTLHTTQLQGLTDLLAPIGPDERAILTPLMASYVDGLDTSAARADGDRAPAAVPHGAGGPVVTRAPEPRPRAS